MKIPKEILVLGLLFLAIAGLCGTAHAEESSAQPIVASGGAYAMWCTAGFVAGNVGTRVAKEKYGKAVSGATELTVSVGGCLAADAGLYSLTDHPGEAPTEAELNQDGNNEPQEQN